MNLESSLEGQHSEDSERYVIHHLNDYKGLLKKVISNLSDFRIILLNGDLGSGKTTFVKKLLRALKSHDEVTSPSFSLINQYEIDGGMVYHMDMYRLKSLDEALEIGVEEVLISDQICLIEWPALVLPLIFPPYIELKFIILDGNTREITASFVKE